MNGEINCNRRMKVLAAFLEAFQEDFGCEFSAAACGSLVIGCPSSASDIDFFLAIAPERLSDVVSTHIFRSVFDSRLTPAVTEQFSSGHLQAFRPPDRDYLGFRLSMNVLSHHLFPKLSQLYDFPVRKFRFAATDSIMAFRGFGNAYGQQAVPVKLAIQSIEGGVIAESRSMLWHNQEPYFHIYVDKFATCMFVYDFFKLASSQVAMRIRLFEEFLRTCHVDPFGFLHARAKASQSQLAELASGVHGDLYNRAVPTNAGYCESCLLNIASIARNAHKIVLLSGPSGVGKDTIARKLSRGWPGVACFTPTTTREPRPGDEPSSYLFRSEQAFLHGRDTGDFLYWQFNGISTRGMAEYYAVPYADLLGQLAACERLVMTVGGEGFASFMKRLFPSCRSVCLWPASSNQLEEQLRGRRSECSEDIGRRLGLFGLWDTTANYFDHVVVNLPGELHETVKRTAYVAGLTMPSCSS